MEEIKCEKCGGAMMKTEDGSMKCEACGDVKHMDAPATPEEGGHDEGGMKDDAMQ